MGLSSEERRRIYEEEKERLEARERIEHERWKDEGGTSTGLKPNTAALLCYLGVWVTGIIFLILEQKSRFVRFHAAQSIVVFGILTLAQIILGWLPIVGSAFSVIIGVIGFILWIIMMVKAGSGERYKLPFAGDIAERIVALPAGGVYDGGAAGGGGESSEDAPPAEPKQEDTGSSSSAAADTARRVGKKAEDCLKDLRVGRVAESSAAIFWGIAILIFLNFFSQYVAYYHDGIREPFLTADFALWLPLLNTTLILSVIGHIILIIFDWRMLRGVIHIVLGCFGVATALRLLVLFPFDFSIIPGATAASYAELGLTIGLIVITVGTGVATLVRFIKLIVGISRRVAA